MRANEAVVEFLTSIPLFEGMAKRDLARVAQEMKPVSLVAGNTLVQEGSEADGLYVVVTGRLRVSVDVDGTEQPLEELVRGDVVGEIALIGDQPRSATVSTVRDSELLRLPVDAYTRLVDKNPAVLRELAKVLVRRLVTANLVTANLRPSKVNPIRTLALVGCGRSPAPLNKLSLAIVDALSRHGRTIRIDRAAVERDRGQWTEEGPSRAVGPSQLAGYLSSVEESHDHVVYVGADGPYGPADLDWIRQCLRHADVVLLVARAEGDPAWGEAERLAEDSLAKRELVLVHPIDANRPLDTGRWTATRKVARTHHVRLGAVADIERVARLVTGHGYGLVLGGGGPRGFAHLGVIKALEEHDIPIDMVGGTSIGAVVGGLLAQGLDHEGRVAQAMRLVTKGRLERPTFPLVSVTAARTADRLLHEVFGDWRIENLWLPYFCVSASITRAEEIVHEDGLLPFAIRASVSLPAAFPPVYRDGELLVDGGVLNNVPVDIMRKKLDSGTLLAVDLSPKEEEARLEPFSPDLSGWKVLARRLDPRTNPMAVPGILEIVTRSSHLASIRSVRANLASNGVDVLFCPPTGNSTGLDFRSSPPLIDVGYQHASQVLSDPAVLARLRPSGRL